jgi:replicative DNA helicase
MADNKLFSVDSELSVITGILRNPSLVHSTDGLRHYMMSATPYQILFEEFEHLKEQQLLPDPQLVLASLESKNMLDKVGGKKEIERLINREEVSEESFKKFVEIVVASYKGRAFLSIVSSAKKENLNADNINDTIKLTKHSLDELTGLGGGSYTIHLSEIAKKAFDEIVQRMSNPGIRGTSWGVPSIDKATGGKSPGDLVIVAGRPGSGKTSIACNSVLADGINGVPTLLISREMRPQELFERLISIDADLPSTNVRLGILNQEQVDKVYASIAKIKTMPIYLDYNFRCSDPFYLESTINKYRKQYGIQNVYLDYIQMATERDENQTQEIGRLTKLFKGMSNDLGICSILLSQLNRNVEARDDKRPILSDMKQAGSIEDDADFVIGLYRDEYYYKETKAKNLMEYIILKHRNGPPGTVVIKYNAPTYKMSEA